MSWYYAEAGKQIGPVADGDFDRLVAAGTIQPDTLVWREGMPDWQAFRACGWSPKAGAVNGAVCAECGRPGATDDMIRFMNLWVCAACKPHFFQRLGEGGTPVAMMHYAGFWIRALAKLMDGIIVGLTGGMLGALAGFVIWAMTTGDQKDAILSLLVTGYMGVCFAHYLIGIPYNIWFVGRYGATPGKMACGLRVVRADGLPLTYARACGRAFADLLSAMILYIGYIMAAFDGEKRALHDHICDTRVIRKQG
ncbi:MAG: RDD family protein [Verrucomicrobiae bacterium]|nr:RDD family protein [Verrucomicrobiae bacterium]